MFKKNGSGNAPAPIDVRFALKTAKPLLSSRGKTQATGKIAIFAAAVILLVIILRQRSLFAFDHIHHDGIINDTYSRLKHDHILGNKTFMCKSKSFANF